MIFHEMGFQDLIASKLKAYTNKLAEKYREINKQDTSYTMVSDEAKNYSFQLAAGRITEEEIPSHIQQELSRATEERLAYGRNVLSGGIILPEITEEELNSLIPTIEELKARATVTLDSIKENIKVQLDGKKA